MNFENPQENKIFLTCSPDSADKVIHIHGDNAILWFGILINRAMRSWDAAPHELKTFADQFLLGQELQPYSKQSPQNTIQTTPKS